MVTVPVFDSTAPPCYRHAPAAEPLHGLAAFEADLIASLSAALDAVHGDGVDDHRRRVLGVAALPWSQAAGEMP